MNNRRAVKQWLVNYGIPAFNLYKAQKENNMTGYESKRAMAQDKLKCQCLLSTKLVGSGCQYCNPEYMDEDDDTQVYKRPWVDLTEDEIEVIEEKALTKQWAIRMALAAVKERNA